MEKTILNIRAEVGSFEEGKELLKRLEVLKEQFEVNVELSIKSTFDLFQANRE